MSDILEAGGLIMGESPSDYETEDPSASEGLKGAGVRNSAALLAMNTDTPIETYNNINLEMQSGQTDLHNQVSTQVVEDEHAANTQLLTQISVDPSLSTEQKTNAVNAVAEKNTDIRAITMSKYLSAPVENETSERESRRLAVAAGIKKAAEHKGQSQALLNSTAANMTFDGVGGYMQVLSSFIPYVSEWATDDIVEKMSSEGFIPAEDASNFFMFAGSNKKAIKDAFSKMTSEEKAKYMDGITKIMEDESALWFSDPNQAIQLETLRSGMEDSYLTDSDVWIENAFGVLDVIAFAPKAVIKGVGKVIIGAGQLAPAAAGYTAKALRSRVRKQGVKGSAQPASPAETVRHVNPDTDRQIHSAIVQDESGDLAKAVKGTDRDSAIADDLLPEMLDENGVNRHIPAEVDRVQREVEHVKELDGRTELSDGEKLSAAKGFERKFKRSKIMSYRAGSSQLGAPDGGVFRMSSVFGETADHGFGSVEDAVEAAADQANRFGLDVETIKLQARNEVGDYVDLSPDDIVDVINAGDGVDIQVKFDFDYKVNPVDITSWEAAGVDQALFGFIAPDKWFPQAGGKLTRWIKDAASTFDVRVAGAGSVVEDRSSRIQKLLLQDSQDVEKQIKSLKVDEQEKLMQVIQLSNKEGISFNRQELVAKGLSDEAIEAHQSFRSYWDRDWRLQNQIRRDRLNADGVLTLENTGTGTKLFGKEDASFIKNIEDRRLEYYDVETDQFNFITKDTPIEDYLGGQRKVYKLEQPLEVEGKKVTWAIANDAGNVRPLNTNDNLIPYRKGYFKTSYVDSHFVVRVEVDDFGKETRSVVQSASSPSGALVAAKRLSRDNELDNVSFIARRDLKDINDIRRMQEEVSTTQDGFRQWHRGEPLGDAEKVVGDADIEDPVEAMTRAAGATARQISYSNWIAASKARFADQYAELLKDKNGIVRYPTKVDDIKTDLLGKEQAMASEARTAWEYINFMENVRMNYGSALWKYGLKSVAEVFGRKAAHGNAVAKAGEKSVEMLAEVKPIEASKHVAFEAAIVLNPLRQLTLGVFDVFTKSAVFDFDFAKGIKDAPAMMAANMALGSKGEVRKAWMRVATGLSGRTEKDITQMLDAFHNSGLVAAIDKQALMAAGLHTEIERATSRSAKAFKGAGAAYNKVSRATAYKGFEYNEYITQGITWAAAYNKASKKGKMLNKAELDKITALTRNLNYGQNRAGELAYNTSALGLLFQFIQIPHKALLLALPKKLGGNKALTGAQKAKLVGASLALYGTPEDFFGVDITGGITENIQDEEIRNTLRHGLVWLGFFNSIDASVSTKELNPFDAEAIAEKFVSLFNGTPYSDSPAMQFAWPRVAEAFRNATAVWGEGYDDYDTIEKFASVRDGFLKISSGYSNYTKTRYAQEHDKFISGSGWVSDPHVTPAEVYLKTAGFRTLDEQEILDSSRNIRKLRNTLREDLKEWYDGYKKSRIALGGDPQEIDHFNRAHAEFWRIWKDDPARDFLQRELHSMIKQDAKQGEAKHLLDILRSVEIMEPGELKAIFNTSGLSQEEIDDGHKFVDDLMNSNTYKEPDDG